LRSPETIANNDNSRTARLIVSASEEAAELRAYPHQLKIVTCCEVCRKGLGNFSTFYLQGPYRNARTGKYSVGCCLLRIHLPNQRIAETLLTAVPSTLENDKLIRTFNRQGTKDNLIEDLKDRSRSANRDGERQNCRTRQDRPSKPLPHSIAKVALDSADQSETQGLVSTGRILVFQ
jgi:hypothetical protein